MERKCQQRTQITKGKKEDVECPSKAYLIKAYRIGDCGSQIHSAIDKSNRKWRLVMGLRLSTGGRIRRFKDNSWIGTSDAGGRTYEGEKCTSDSKPTTEKVVVVKD